MHHSSRSSLGNASHAQQVHGRVWDRVQWIPTTPTWPRCCMAGQPLPLAALICRAARRCRPLACAQQVPCRCRRCISCCRRAALPAGRHGCEVAHAECWQACRSKVQARRREPAWVSAFRTQSKGGSCSRGSKGGRSVNEKLTAADSRLHTLPECKAPCRMLCRRALGVSMTACEAGRTGARLCLALHTAVAVGGIQWRRQRRRERRRQGAAWRCSNDSDRNVAVTRCHPQPHRPLAQRESFPAAAFPLPLPAGLTAGLATLPMCQRINRRRLKGRRRPAELKRGASRRCGALQA